MTNCGGEVAEDSFVSSSRSAGAAVSVTPTAKQGICVTKGVVSRLRFVASARACRKMARWRPTASRRCARCRRRPTRCRWAPASCCGCRGCRSSTSRGTSWWRCRRSTGCRSCRCCTCSATRSAATLASCATCPRSCASSICHGTASRGRRRGTSSRQRCRCSAGSRSCASLKRRSKSCRIPLRNGAHWPRRTNARCRSCWCVARCWRRRKSALRIGSRMRIHPSRLGRAQMSPLFIHRRRLLLPARQRPLKQPWNELLPQTQVSRSAGASGRTAGRP